MTHPGNAYRCDLADSAISVNSVNSTGSAYRLTDKKDDAEESSEENKSPQSRNTNILQEDIRAVLAEITGDKNSYNLYRRLYQVILGTPAMKNDILVARIYNILHVVMVVTSVLTYIIMSFPEFYSPEIETSGIAFIIECVTVGFFTMDFILRLIIARSWRQRISVGMFVDLMSFFGFYVEVILAVTWRNTSNTSSPTAVLALRALRLGRVFRLFKVARSHRGFKMLMEVVAKSKDGLFLLIALVMIATLICASILYYIEISTCILTDDLEWLREDGTISPFRSIPETFWFISVSITTVGYGDQVPFNIWGRLWVTVVMLFGVLVLSFPNILIGFNFADVHKAMSKEKSWKQLGMYFRRVRMVVRFIRMWREFRVNGRINLIQGSEGGQATGGNIKRRMNFFIFRISDFPDHYLNECSDRAILGNIDLISHQGLTLLNVMQRLLECFSSCATISELHTSFNLFPCSASKVTINSIFEVCLKGAASQFITLFILDRDAEEGILTLTKKGIDVMLNFPENANVPCLRCYSEAREIWIQTVKRIPYDFFPLDGYRSWQMIQQKMTKRPALDFVYDYRNPESNKNNIFEGLTVRNISNTDSKSQCTCRFCHITWGLSAPLRNRPDYCFHPDEEFLEMELEYALQAKEILRLENKVISFSNVTEDTILAVKPANELYE